MKTAINLFVKFFTECSIYTTGILIVANKTYTDKNNRKFWKECSKVYVVPIGCQTVFFHVLDVCGRATPDPSKLSTFSHLNFRKG